MASGSYFPPPVKESEIPKKDGKVRKLGIPTISDRVGQMVYARTDTEMKRKAIEKSCPDIVTDELPEWSKDKELLFWLSELK